MQNLNPDQYLAECEVINFSNPDVAQLATQLRVVDNYETIERCFRFVRDEIKHSSDFQLNPVTCTASDTLKYRTGFCYAKSHLLCALLRANNIATGLCYQRLSVDDTGAPFCLHGLNAVFLPDIGWYRLDSRGNRIGIDAQFTPPDECLAFSIRLPGEYDLDEIYVSPLPSVVAALQRYQAWEELLQNLPDVEC